MAVDSYDRTLPTVARRMSPMRIAEVRSTSNRDESTNSKVVAITGGGSGIGEATAYKLASKGFDVAVIDISTDRAEVVTRKIIERGGRALAVEADVRRADSVERAFAVIEDWRKPVDILVYSAGILKVAPVLEYDLSDFQSVMEVNVTGAFLCAQRAAKGMLTQKYGRIITLSSISAERAGIGRIAYGTSKAAVAALTRQLAMELGCFGITANAVAPGPINTRMTYDSYTPETRHAYEKMIPARRLGTVEDIANVIAFLSSEDAGYVNGITLAVDGGFLAAGVGTTGELKT